MITDEELEILQSNMREEFDPADVEDSPEEGYTNIDFDLSRSIFDTLDLTEEGYAEYEKFCNEKYAEVDGCTIGIMYDGSGYNYWTNIQEESNYATIYVNVPNGVTITEKVGATLQNFANELIQAYDSWERLDDGILDESHVQKLIRGLKGVINESLAINEISDELKNRVHDLRQQDFDAKQKELNIAKRKLDRNTELMNHTRTKNFDGRYLHVYVDNDSAVYDMDVNDQLGENDKRYDIDLVGADGEPLEQRPDGEPILDWYTTAWNVDTWSDEEIIKYAQEQIGKDLVPDDIRVER